MKSASAIRSIILLLTLASVFAFQAGAEGTQQAALYDKPAELKLERTIRFRFGRPARDQPGQGFSTESFYPIGWSKDGKFAYYVEPVDEACDCYFAKLFILDLKNDKILWSFDYNSEFLEEAKEAKRPYSFATLWNANKKQFSEKLREHGIVQQHRFALLSFPISYMGDRLTTELKLKEIGDEEARLYGVVNRATLLVRSQRKGRKTVLDETFSEVRPLDLRVVGYVKSPYEPKIAIILVAVYRGYEGPPHVGEVKIVGATLASGY